MSPWRDFTPLPLQPTFGGRGVTCRHGEISPPYLCSPPLRADLRNPRPGDLKGRKEERGPVLEPPSPETEKSNNRSIFLSRGTRGTARTATSLPPTTPPRQASSHALEPSSGPDGLISPNIEISPSGLEREERSKERIRRDFPFYTTLQGIRIVFFPRP